MGLEADLLRGIFDFGISKPTEIQKRAIMPIIERRDTIIVGPHFSGRSMALMIGMIDMMDPNCNQL